MTPLESDVRRAVMALLNDWVDPSEDARERFLASVADSFTGIGTAPKEYFQGREELRGMIEREQAALSYPVTLDVPWMNVNLQSESMTLAVGELALEIQMDEETFVEAPRFSLILERDDASAHGWRLLHFHMSYPDAMQDEGATMGDLLTTRNRELEREVTRRTNELREQAAVLRTLNETNAILAAELDLDKLVQRLVDAGRDVIGASMGAFFYNVEMRDGMAYASYALSGIPREAFEQYPLPRMTEVFRPTFYGEGMLRSDDILADPRYGANNGTHGGMPPDHPPVRSFLSSPVIGRSGDVIGGLLFGHPEPSQFTEQHEALIAGVANQAAIAIGNARLYDAAQNELDERRRTEAALAEAKGKAEAANHAKSAFLAKMSHELRTPLNGILGYAQLLQRAPDVLDTHRQGLTIIEQSGRHLLTLINDVLDLAKIEAGKLQVDAAPFRLPDMLRTVTAIADVQAKGRGLMFTYEASASLPTLVQGDERRLRQVLLNLLSNAIKFTEQGTVTLRVQVMPTEADGTAWVQFDVEDSGVGIAPDQVETIFEPFEQVRDGRHSDGTGLGLPITRRLTHLMGGTLSLDTTPGTGSRFRVDLPFTVVPETHQDRPSTTLSNVTGVRGRPKVLVVDDKAVNRSILTSLLVPLGFEVTEAPDGQAALEQADAIRPDVILMDLVMPIMDGFEATRQLRMSHALRSIPIVALSASVFDATQQESLATGCDAFLPKPVDVDALLATLHRLLDLEWIHANQTADEAAPTTAASTTDATPTPKEAAMLYDFAMQGDVQGLLTYLDTLDRLHAGTAFSTTLRSLAARFRMQDIRTTIEPYLTSDHD